MATNLNAVRSASGAHIYCHVCKSIQPLVVDDPQRAHGGPYEYAMDWVCGGCQFVVTTTYALRSARSEALKTLRAA